MAKRTDYIWNRIGVAFITVFVTVAFNFVLFRVLPGNAADRIARIPNASPALRHALEVQFGLDKPLLIQFLDYLRQTAMGNLGVSFATRQPVADLLWQSFLNTIPMVSLGTVLALILGIAIGVFSAVRRGTVADHIVTAASVIFYAFPTQFLGMMILIAFSGVLPSAGMVDPFLLDNSVIGQAIDIAKHMIMPVLTLVLTLCAGNVLIVRSAMLETLGEDYILTAKAKGLSSLKIIWSHALRNAMLPITTMVAMSLSSIVTGSILVEVIFSWPGIGQALYQAVLQRDYPMLQGGFLVITIVVILFNLISDLLYYRLDPRVN
ncbi:ABC transporter permease [Acidocella sp.]|uniref:ABC transporter permease n=1 Tax=Acidocella sp. TaxID=50710 RepID=UPI0026363232|nr:ABC transporter permease [Acidocella sp.]